MLQVEWRDQLCGIFPYEKAMAVAVDAAVRAGGVGCDIPAQEYNLICGVRLINSFPC